MNYKEILENIVKNGTPKQPVRFDSNNNPIPVENGTIGTFCEIFRHNMIDGFPLSTLRRMPFKSMSIELEGFIKAITDKSWYKNQGCGFWNEWANPQAVYKKIKKIASKKIKHEDEEYIVTSRFKKNIQEQEIDLGPIYGYQWRNFGGHYGDVDFHNSECSYIANGQYLGVDQLKSIVDKLKTNPYDRRMVCSAWNPHHEYLMALPPCHYAFTVVVYDDKLNLCWKQRSVDSILGLPNNIASYALLLLLLCEESGLQPGELVGVLEDCHIYENHLETTRELLKREERELPTVRIKRKPDGSFSIFDWTWQDVELIDYDPHPKLNMGAVTV